MLSHEGRIPRAALVALPAARLSQTLAISGDETTSAAAPPANTGTGTNAAATSASGASAASRADWSVGELLRWTSARFAELGIAEARLDAEYLLAFALGCTRMRLYTEHDRLVDDDARARFRECVRRRMAREPVAQIEGKRGFHALDLELHVDRRVLVPRPETEHLVDWLLEDLGHDPSPVIDVGTGSGAIALAIKRARPEADVHAVDVSDDALDVARSNAERSGLAVTFVRSDLLEGVAPPAGGWGVIAANLPYIPTDVIATLEPEVRVFEPRLALDGGADGLEIITRLLAQIDLPGVIAPQGAAYLEVGHDQAQQVAQMFVRMGWTAATRNDHAGICRIVRARPPASR